MLDKLDLQIVLVMLEAKELLTSQDLAVHFSKSSRTIRNRLNKIESTLFPYGVNVFRKPGVGISIEIEDETRFEQLLDLYPVLRGDQVMNIEQDLKNLILLMFSYGDYIRSDDLSQKLWLSRSKVTSLLFELRNILKNYDLVLESKPHYGVRIQGSELNIRRFISSYYVQDNWFIDEHIHDDMFSEYAMIEQEVNTLKMIRSIVLAQLKQQRYEMSEAVLKSLCIHLFITIKRLQAGNTLIEMNALSLQDSDSVETQLAQQIVDVLEEQFQVVFTEYELIHITMHFLSKRVLHEDQKRTISPEVNQLIESILQTVKSVKQIDLLEDLNLRMMLGLHMVPLLSRLEYGIFLKNPMLDEVKAKCVVSYDLAIVAAKLIEQHYNVRVSDHELSYLAIHFDVALIKQAGKKQRKRILIICASGRASAQLLRIKFDQLFKAHIEVMHVCDISEAQQFLNRKEYDYVFSTIHLPKTIVSPYPIFEFSFFLDEPSIKKIESVLSTDEERELLGYFDERLFFPHMSFTTREAVVKFMVTKAAQVFTLPVAFENLVWERENFSGTDILDLIALPHPAQVVSETTFVAVMLLEQPLLWSAREVQVIFLVSVSRHDSEQYKHLMEKIVNLASSPKALHRLLNHQSYTQLIEELNRK